MTGLALAAVVASRRASEQRLQQSHQGLEQIVRDRTQSLTVANAGLRQEMAERQRAEESLREREFRYRKLIEHLHVGVVVHAPDTSILLSNERTAELLNVRASQMPGKTDDDPAWSFVPRTGRLCRSTNIQSIESWPHDSRCGISCLALTARTPEIAGG